MGGNKGVLKAGGGEVGPVAKDAAAAEKCDDAQARPLWWHVGSVKRVVRVTLAAVADGVS